MQADQAVAAAFRQQRRYVGILGVVAFLQMFLIAPVYNRDAEGLFWAARTDSCPSTAGGDVEFQWYSYMFCVEIRGVQDCREYPDDLENETTMLANASRAYPACMALATVTMLLSLLQVFVATSLLYTQRKDDEPCAIAISNLWLFSAGCNGFVVINCICISALSGGGDAQTGDNDFFGTFGCNSILGPDDSELGYGTSVHIALVFWFLIQLISMLCLVNESWKLRQMLRPRNAGGGGPRAAQRTFNTAYGTVARRGNEVPQVATPVIATAYATPANAQDVEGVEIVQAIPVNALNSVPNAPAVRYV